MSKKLVLIDGHSILNRAFYGVPDLSNASGLHTNAVYGFLNILFKLLEEEKPDYLAVAFDVHAPTFRHEIYSEYKGTRKPMPQELREQVPVMKEVLSAMGICMMEQAGLEADDILGTLAKKAEKEGIAVSLVSGDRDLLQIASKNIKIRIPKTKGSRTEIEDYYEEDVLARYQVTPAQFIELKALMGDTADNIPGVPKIGEKTATSLMTEYGSLQEIYAHVEEISKNSIRESLKQNKELAELSKVLATIKTDCGVALDYEKAKAEGYFTKEAYELFKKLEFKNMLGRFEKDSQSDRDGMKDVFKIVSELAEAERVWETAGQKENAGFYFLKDREQKGFAGLALAFSDREVFFFPAEGFLTEEYLACKMRELSGKIRLATYDIKNQYAYLSDDSTERYFDVLIAAYLLNPLKNDYEIEDIAGEYLNLMIPGRKQVFGKESVRTLFESQRQQAVWFACYGAYVSLKAWKPLKERLKETGMLSLMEEIEMPLSLVLYSMEGGRSGQTGRIETLRRRADRQNQRAGERNLP